MALRLGSIQHRPGLLWRLRRPDGESPWLPLLRAAAETYILGIAGDGPPDAWPTDLREAVGAEPMNLLATLAEAPGMGFKAHDQGHWILLVTGVLSPTTHSAAAQFDQIWHTPAVDSIALLQAGWSAAQLHVLPLATATAEVWRQWLTETLTPIGDRPPMRFETDRLHRARQAAENAFAQDDYASVITTLQPWLDHPSVDGELVSLYGTALVFADLYAEAIPVLLRALTFDPAQANAYSLLGVALFTQGHLHRAWRCCRAALAYQPDHPGALASLPAIAKQLTEHNDAVEPTLPSAWAGLDTLLSPFDGGPAVRLSVAMIVRNEALRLPQAIASVRVIADELIVVDTGSTDGTPEIAAALGAQVHHAPWTDDFAAARNESLMHCTGDWILILDADETMTPEGAAALRAVIDRPHRVPTLYQIRIQSQHDDGQASVDWDASRLFPRALHLRFEGRIHEQLPGQLADGRLLPRVPLPAVTVRHEGHRRTVGAALGKENRDVALLELAIAEQPSNAFHHFNLGVALRATGREHDAIRSLKRSLDRCREQQESPAYVPLAFTHWVSALLALDDPAGAVRIAQGATGLCGQVADFWLAVGQARYALGHVAEARAAFEECLTVGRQHHQMAVDQGALTWKPHVGLAEVLAQGGDTAGSEDHLRAALAVRPDLWAVRRMLLLSMATHQALLPPPAELLPVLQDADAQRRQGHLQDLAENLLATGQAETALAVLSLAVETTTPEARPDARVALAKALRMTGNADAAVALLHRDPDHPAAREELWLLYLQQDRWLDLEQAATARLAIAPADHRALAFRGVARLRTGQPATAAIDLRAAIAGQPGDADSWNNLGLVAMSQQNPGEAEQAFRQAGALQPQDPTPWLNLARLALHRQDFPEARQLLAQVVMTLPEGLRKAMLRQDRQALAHLLGGPEQQTFRLLVTEHLTLDAQLNAGTGMALAALRALALAIDLTPDQAFLYRLTGGLLHDAGEIGLAHQYYAKALSLAPGHVGTAALVSQTAGPRKAPADLYSFLEVGLSPV
ncbi:MAG: glycosyltransferase [Candidatus Sericytochromatia bacterium]|nr:glycosyltransferase [Candidatus Sericytochromatia bacterium]